jgi:5-hydroxyisourate hydrolase-like protein (transthyretin family)
VRPTLRLLNSTVHNRGRPAVFKGRIPGPNAAGVTVLLQVEDGNGWRVYRQGLTSSNGRFVMHYPFRQTFFATTYTMRAKVNRQRGYAYEPGASKKIKVPVLP